MRRAQVMCLTDEGLLILLRKAGAFLPADARITGHWTNSRGEVAVRIESLEFGKVFEGEEYPRFDPTSEK